MWVKDVLKSKGQWLVTATPGEVISSALLRFETQRVGALVVTRTDGGLAGLLSERDVVRGLITRGSAVLGMRVADVMSTDVWTCTPEDTVAKAMQVMTDHRTRHLPVLDGDKLCGLLSIGDVVKARLDDIELENRVLRDLAQVNR